MSMERGSEFRENEPAIRATSRVINGNRIYTPGGSGLIIRAPKKRSSELSNHIPYSPAEDMTDTQLSEEIAAMENSRSAPRKEYLRHERIQRQISELGLAQTEILLGIVEVEENNG